MNQDDNTLVLKFTPQSMQDVQNLARSLNSSPAKVVAEALALLKAAQGRTVILKGERQSVEIKNYVSLSTQAKFEIK